MPTRATGSPTGDFSGAPTELIGAPPPPPPDEPPPDRELWPWLLVLLVLVLAGLGAAWAATRDKGGTATPRTRQTTVVAGPVTPKAKPKKNQATSTTPTTTAVTTVVVPDLVGQSRDDALSTLQAQGLTGDVHEVPSTKDAGTVVSQHPAGGEKVDKGSSVFLNVSSGPSAPATTAQATTTAPAQPVTVSVPDVTGQSVGEASSTLKSAGLEPSVQHVPSTEPKDTVVSQSPGGGSQAHRGDHVLLNISKGPSKSSNQAEPTTAPTPAAATVPSVVGEDKNSAQADLTNAGFQPVVMKQDVSDPSQDNVVIDQSPSAGSTAPPNSPVTIYVGHFKSD